MGHRTRYPIEPETAKKMTERFRELVEHIKSRCEYTNQAEIATHMGLSIDTFKGIYQGRKSLTIGGLLMVCKRTETDPSWLLGFDER